MRTLVGTSGYAYKEWKGTFYPEAAKSSEMLRYYAERLDSVEINNTFYRMPSEPLLRGWAEQVPASFRFVLKVPQRITHRKRLHDAGEDLAYLLRTSAVLGERLGSMLFQLPPSMKKDAERLRAFLELLPADRQAAFEFRHSSWFDDEIYAALSARNAALVVADLGADTITPIVPTADHGYFRLRKEDYTDAEIEEWARRIAAQPWKEASAFFKHEQTGPALALKLASRLRGVQRGQ